MAHFIFHRSTVFLLTQPLLFALTLRAATATTHSAFPTFSRRLAAVKTFPIGKTDISWRSSLLSARGGALDDDEYDEYDEEEYDDDELFELDDGNFEVAEDEFAEANYVDRTLEAWKKTPPLTKGYLTACFAATMLGYLTNKNQFPSIFELKWKAVWKKMQIWRPFTAFLNIGPFNLGYMLTFQFVWTYMSTLERLNHDRPYDFWIMVAFGCFSMLAGYPLLKLNATFLGHNLSTYFVYVWSRYHEGMDVSIFELFKARAELLPWFFIAQTFLLEGQPPVLDLLGIAFGHVYHHCKTSGMLPAPRFLINWYLSDSPFSTAIRNKYKKISSDFQLQEMEEEQKQ